MKKTIGYNIESNVETTSSNDVKCPYTGEVSVRGKMFEGTVISALMAKTVKVEWETIVKDSKYNRYLKNRTKVAAHNSDAVSAKVGDKVLIAECRPLSKTKKFVVIKVIERAQK
jgi:small subunit ribosomal protein S17